MRYVASTIELIWQTFSLKAHGCKTVKLSTDRLFVELVRDIVGRYLSLRDGSLVLCVDAKSQTQALDWTPPL